jgi:hypothetical protein
MPDEQSELLLDSSSLDEDDPPSTPQLASHSSSE